jgi:quercetin dioxygenase-like cupin family protein
MKSESIPVPLTRYRRKPRWLRSKWLVALAVAAAGSGVYAANVLATPSSGLSTTILAQSEFNSFFAQRHAFPPAWGALMAAYGQTDVYMVDNKIDPGGTTGWHMHPGPSLILVVSGQVTNYTSEDRDCAGHTYTAGQGFIDGGGNDKHTLRNNGTAEAETIAVQLIPHGAPRKTDEPNPTHCPV